MPNKLPFLPDDHHYAIANVAVVAAQLEHMIEATIDTALLERPRTAEFILKTTSAERLVGLLEAVLLDLAPKKEADITKLIADIRRLRSERNDIMHWIWSGSDEPDTARHATMRPYRETKAKTKKANEIQTIADEMTAVIDVLGEWVRTGFDRRIASLRDTLAPPTPPHDSASS